MTVLIYFLEVGSDSEKCSPMSKSWTQDDMDLALDALRNRQMSLTKASITYGIPSTTLWQRAHRLGIDTPKKDGPSKSWNEEVLNVALEALRTGTISANKASKAYGKYIRTLPSNLYLFIYLLQTDYGLLWLGLIKCKIKKRESSRF